MGRSIGSIGRRSLSRGAGALIVILALGSASPVTATEELDRTPSEIASLIEVREALGLAADAGVLADLIDSSADVGSARWGIPMTSAEAAQVAFDDRMDFAVRVEQVTMPWIASMPNFASAYFDSRSHGELVVALTSIDASSIEFVASHMPRDSRGLRIMQRAVTDASLVAAMRESSDLWSRFFPAIHLVSTTLDSVNGELAFGIGATQLAGAQLSFADFQAELGVPARLVVAVEPRDTTCTSRDYCASPLRPGVRLYKGVIDSYNECTMAFVVYTNSLDVQLLTAGHCGKWGSNNWYHPGLPGNHLIGTDQATLYGPEGKDLMRIQMPDNQAFNVIYGDPNYPIQGYVYPLSGMPVCASRGHANVISCGTINATWVRWFSDTAGYYVWGGDSNLPSMDGDSGSPIYQRVALGNGYAVGTLSNTSGNFGRVDQALALLGPLGIWVPDEDPCLPPPC